MLDVAYSPLGTTDVGIEWIPNGTYRIQLELTNWEIPTQNGVNRATYTFNKNGTAQNPSLLDQGGYTNVSITYTGRPPGPNYRPGVYAGPDQWITMPSANLQGTATDEGAAPAVTWRKDSGPGTVSFGNANALSTTATFSTEGVYVLELEADDGSLQSYDYVKVYANTVRVIATEDAQVNTVNPNTPDAGDFRLRVNNVLAGTQSEAFMKFHLSGVPSTVVSAKLQLALNDYGVADRQARDVTDDSWSGSTVTWNTRPASGSSSIGSFTSGNGWREVDVTNFIATEYQGDKVASLRVLRESAMDDWLRINSQETYLAPRLLVTYSVPNQAPTVDAGSDQDLLAVTFPVSATLDGTVADDGRPTPPGTVTTTWTKVSGPGTATFANAAAVDTTVSFSAEGTCIGCVSQQVGRTGELASPVPFASIIGREWSEVYAGLSASGVRIDVKRPTAGRVLHYFVKTGTLRNVCVYVSDGVVDEVEAWAPSGLGSHYVSVAGVIKPGMPVARIVEAHGAPLLCDYGKEGLHTMVWRTGEYLVLVMGHSAFLWLGQHAGRVFAFRKGHLPPRVDQFRFFTRLCLIIRSRRPWSSADISSRGVQAYEEMERWRDTD